MRYRKKKTETNDNYERWLLTYADLITLLLAFFIVMYSMSRIDAKRFGKMAEALSGVLKGGETVLENVNGEDIRKGFGLLKLGDLNLIQKQINERFKNIGREEEVQTEITERGLVIHIMESALFKVGSAVLEDKAISILEIIYERIEAMPNHIRIE
ncbi:MAG: flagellar motor protein MotB, partial [Candidatus Zixiibacteriota bacterium]